MDSLTGPYVELAALADERLGVVCPHARGVDDLPRADVERVAVLQVAHLHAGDPLPLPQEADDTGLVGDVCPVRRRRPHDVHGVAGVVDLGVPVLHGADQRVLAQRGGDAQRAAAGEVPVPRQPAAAPAERAEGVVQRDAGTDVGPLPAAPRERIEEGHGPYEVRGEPLEDQARSERASETRRKSSISR